MQAPSWKEIAAAVVRTVGDGCVVRSLEPGSMGFAAVAADHRDPVVARRLQALLGEPALEPPHGAWLRQAVATRRAVRVPGVSSADLTGAGLPVDERIGDVVIVPVAGLDAAVVALRGHATGPYGVHERRALERLAALTRREAPGPPPSVSSPLLEDLPAAIAVTDRAGIITYVNQASCELTGVTPDGLVGSRLDSFVAGGPGFGSSGFSGTEPSDHVLVRHDQSTGWVSLSSRPLFDPAGRWHATVHTMVDVTDRRRREAAMRTRLDFERVLGDFAEELLNEEAPEAMPRRAVDLVAEQFGAPLVFLAEIDRERQHLLTLATAGDRAGACAEFPGYRYELPEESPAMAALEAGEPVSVGDFEAEGYLPGPIERVVGAGSAACAPIAGGAACIGVARPEIGGVDEEERQALGAVAALLSGRWPDVRRAARDTGG